MINYDTNIYRPTSYQKNKSVNGDKMEVNGYFEEAATYDTLFNRLTDLHSYHNHIIALLFS